MEINAQYLAIKLIDRLEDVLDALGLVEIRKKPCRKRREFVLHWVGHGEASIYLGGDKKGAWTHFSTGEKGDLYDLVACVLGNGFKDRKAAFDWSKRFLGLDRDFTPKEREDFAAKMATETELAKIRAKKREQEAKSELAKDRRIATAKFLNSKNSPKGTRRVETGDRVYQYLSARGIDFDKLGKVPGSIRFWPNHEFRDDNGGKIKFDAMICSMIMPNGKIGAIHQTWLDAEYMDKKAPIYVEKNGKKKQMARKIWPSYSGCFIPLWLGKSGVSRTKAKPQSETILICEGVEDGLTHAMYRPDCRIDVVGALANYLEYVPPESCKELILAADRDWDKPQAIELFNKAKQRFADLGKPKPFKPPKFTVKVIYPPEGYKDFNDALRRANKVLKA